jgi:hypothetical protein
MIAYILVSKSLPPLDGTLPSGTAASRLCDVILADGRETKARLHVNSQWGSGGFLVPGEVVAWRQQESNSSSIVGQGG